MTSGAAPEPVLLALRSEVVRVLAATAAGSGREPAYAYARVQRHLRARLPAHLRPKFDRRFPVRASPTGDDARAELAAIAGWLHAER